AALRAGALRGVRHRGLAPRGDGNLRRALGQRRRADPRNRIRSALGASPGGILSLVVRQGFALTALGAAIGLTAAIAASQALVGLLFAVSRLDPLTYVAMVALLLVVSLVACWMPAWRAARVDPAIALRAE